jgi:hypothetical protein
VRPDSSRDSDYGGGAHVRAGVLRCAVPRADDGGGLWWSEPMLEAACMHVWAPHRAVVWTVMLRHQI